jgi:hypothetical protein
MKRFLIYTITATLLMSLALSFGACRKKEDTVARITVRDTANMLVPNARVILFGQSTTDPIQPVVLRDTAFTNSSGVATFLFNDVYQLGQAGVAVLNIAASRGNLNGQGIIKIVEEVENTATVFIQ